MKSKLKSAFIATTGLAFAASSAMGALSFTDGDLILGIQATGGQGQGQNVFFNLGAGTYHRDNAGNLGSPTSGNNPFGTSGQTQIGNINSTLVSVYGANWYSRTDLWFGIAGNLNGNPNTGIGFRDAVDGDPSRTFYLSSAASEPGTATLYGAGTFPSAALGAGGTSLSGVEMIMPTLTLQGDGAGILDQVTQPVEWYNGWTEKNPTPGAAFNVFTGGIQQSFGQSGSATYVDLQRILSTNTGSSVPGVVGGGSYMTTFAIGSDGSITSVPEPSTGILAILACAGIAFRRRR